MLIPTLPNPKPNLTIAPTLNLNLKSKSNSRPRLLRYIHVIFFFWGGAIELQNVSLSILRLNPRTSGFKVTSLVPEAIC